MRLLFIAFIWIGLTLAGLLFFAPYVSMEMYAATGASPHEDSDADPYWYTKEIAPGVIAIYEPEFYQRNWHYLLIGETRAILFDTGPGFKGIKSFAEGLTDKPITAMASHLHYDHTGNLHEFERVAMVDLPSIHGMMEQDVLKMDRYAHLGFVDNLPVHPVKVTEWIADGGSLDIGGRQLSFLSVPGHTTDSVVLHDKANNLLLTGDYLYPSDLFAFLPNSSRKAYRESARRLLDTYPNDVRLFGAHAAPDTPHTAPEMTMKTVQSLHDRMLAEEMGEIAYRGIFPRFLNIENGINMLTGFVWNNR